MSPVCRIQPAQAAERGVHVPDHVVARHDESSRARAFRQRELADLHRDRIHAANLVRAVVGHPHRALRVLLQAVGQRARRRQRDQLDLAGRGNHPSEHVALLQREEQRPVLVEDPRVRIARLGIGHLELGDLSRRRHELTDGPVAVPHVPDIARRIVHDAVGTRGAREARTPAFHRCSDSAVRPG